MASLTCITLIPLDLFQNGGLKAVAEIQSKFVNFYKNTTNKEQPTNKD
jgi:hypothetical protein